MAIEFEFTVSKEFDFAEAFADRFNLNVSHDRVDIPDSLGAGFIREIYLTDEIKLCLHQYTLKKPFVLKRQITSSDDVLTIKFDGRRVWAQPNGYSQEPLFPPNSSQAVEITTSNLFAQVTLPPNQTIYFLVITITRKTLLDLLRLDAAAHSIDDTLRNNESFVFHEGMTQAMERTLQKLSVIDESTKLPTLLYQTKVQELIYLLFEKLLTRSTGKSVPVSQADVEKVYAVRAAVLADLSVTPRLSQLARSVGMSESRMSKFFRQIFGESIYSYYQTARITEAARLLQELPVAETGYKLGFTNLSHFARVFERHYYMKPKRYKDTLEIPLQ